jgi:hypothetical protein
MRLEVLGKLKKCNNLIGNRTLGLPACSIVPQPTALPRAPEVVSVFKKNAIKTCGSGSQLHAFLISVLAER